MSDDAGGVKPATDEERQRWADDARLGFVRPSREPYVRDPTVVAKVLSLNARIDVDLARADRAEERVAAMEAALREVIEPGVFGPWSEVLDPLVPDSVRDLCEQIGYGAVLHHVAFLWQSKHCDSAHTVAGCVGTRRAMIAKIKEVLGDE